MPTRAPTSVTGATPGAIRPPSTFSGYRPGRQIQYNNNLQQDPVATSSHVFAAIGAPEEQSARQIIKNVPLFVARKIKDNDAVSTAACTPAQLNGMAKQWDDDVTIASADREEDDPLNVNVQPEPLIFARGFDSDEALATAEGLQSIFTFEGPSKINVQNTFPMNSNGTIGDFGVHEMLDMVLSDAPVILGKFLWWVLKRRRNAANGSYGAFAWHLVATDGGRQPDYSERMYRDPAGRVRYGPYQAVGEVVSQPGERPSMNEARAAHGLDVDTSVAYQATLGLPKIKVLLVQTAFKCAFPGC